MENTICKGKQIDDAKALEKLKYQKQLLKEFRRGFAESVYSYTTTYILHLELKKDIRTRHLKILHSALMSNKLRAEFLDKTGYIDKGVYIPNSNDMFCLGFAAKSKEFIKILRLEYLDWLISKV